MLNCEPEYGTKQWNNKKKKLREVKDHRWYLENIYYFNIMSKTLHINFHLRVATTLLAKLHYYYSYFTSRKTEPWGHSVIYNYRSNN